MVSRGKSGSTPPRGNADLLTSFLASVDRFTETISAQAVTAAGTGEELAPIQSTGESFVAQTRRLTDYIREIAPGIGPVQRREVEQFLRIQDGDALVERSLQVSAQTLAAGPGAVTMGFLGWLNEVLHTLKKIIRKLLDLFGGVPKWLDAIFVIIDELANMLKTLLGARFGLKMSEVADQGSREEVNFLREMTALTELETAQRSGRSADEEPSN